MEDYSKQTGKGIAYGLAAYLWWGLAIFYFKWVAHVPAPEILAHRIIWSVLFLGVILLITKQVKPALQALKDKKTHLFLAITTILIAGNWLVFIWAIANNRILDTSLGYFINPLVNILFGYIFLRERFRKIQWLCVLLAFIGVAIQTIGFGSFPWIALSLAFSFSLYGLIRKKTPLEGTSGLAAETALLLPFAIGYLIYLYTQKTMIFSNLNLTTDLLLLAAGIVTSAPLIWFVIAAKRLKYSTIGFMTYIAPTISFLIAVLVYNEPLGTAKIISFGFIWVALMIYSIDSVIHEKRNH